MALDVSTFTENIGLRNLKRENVSRQYQDLFKKPREILRKDLSCLHSIKNLLKVGYIDPVALGKMIPFSSRKPVNFDRSVILGLN